MRDDFISENLPFVYSQYTLQPILGSTPSRTSLSTLISKGFYSSIASASQPTTASFSNSSSPSLLTTEIIISSSETLTASSPVDLASVVATAGPSDSETLTASDSPIISAPPTQADLASAAAGALNLETAENSTTSSVWASAIAADWWNDCSDLTDSNWPIISGPTSLVFGRF
ncbi:hypothetical protein AVEN_112511-1 [Araneus ventricosus]|uniref:Uncharacterized protein n=1 Tax=Araneus ventricosus TaxID=182803 RepID=A0A4Y2VDC4_ARAVE|nr:hypothetical protein AVEN_112511-1 [Araneus ventricosus]